MIYIPMAQVTAILMLILGFKTTIMHEIQLPLAMLDYPFAKVKAYCEHFNCKVTKPKRGEVYYKIESANPINFFWLGANLSLRSTSTLTITPAEQFLING